jgi:hypothetical protein
MTREPREADELAAALERIAVYAEGMTRHYQQQGFGEVRSWRMIVHYARSVLDPNGPPLPTTAPDPVEREPANDELERLLVRCRLLRDGADELALPSAQAHELIEQLAKELLLWRHSHPDDLPG